MNWLTADATRRIKISPETLVEGAISNDRSDLDASDSFASRNSRREALCDDFAGVDVRLVCIGSRPCENAKAINRDRTNYSFKTFLCAHIASAFNFEIEIKNIILVALRTL